MPRLRRSDCSTPGITRRRCGSGFVYLDSAGERLRDPVALQRIEELAIPPAWREVWICEDALGHLQATGIDAAGRKQYLYHQLWRDRRDRQKFQEMLEFARTLPRLRPRVRAGLRHEELDRERVVACALRLLDVGCLRIGSEDYARENGSHGLTTLLREHARVRDGTQIVLDFPAKGGKQALMTLEDAAAAAVVGELLRRRSGDQLLAYRDGRRWRELSADDVNADLKAYTGNGFSAKDFRTWNATLIAAVALARMPPPSSARAAKGAISQALTAAAELLGNTPAVCRASYVDPRLFDHYASGNVIDASGVVAADRALLGDWRRRARLERELVELLGG